MKITYAKPGDPIYSEPTTILIGGLFGRRPKEQSGDKPSGQSSEKDPKSKKTKGSAQDTRPDLVESEESQ